MEENNCPIENSQASCKGNVVELKSKSKFKEMQVISIIQPIDP